MIDPAATLTAAPLGAGEALAVGGLALFLALFGGRLAESTARRVGFGPILSVTVLAAAGWISLYGLGLLAPPAGYALGLPMAILVLSSLFLIWVFAAESRAAREDQLAPVLLTDWQGRRGSLAVSPETTRPTCTTNSSSSQG